MGTLRIPLPKLTSVARLEKLALAGAEYRDWYVWATDQVTLAAEELDIDPKKLADYLAIFSPRVSVRRSIRWTLHYLRTGEFMPDVTRSHKAAMLHYNLTGEIRGPKTGPFALALRGNVDALVLDSWMGKALGIEPDRLAVQAVWKAAAARVLSVAKRLGWTPTQTQAAIWAGIVLEERINVPALNILSELGSMDTLPPF